VRADRRKKKIRDWEVKEKEREEKKRGKKTYHIGEFRINFRRRCVGFVSSLGNPDGPHVLSEFRGESKKPLNLP